MDAVKSRVDEITDQLEQGLKELFESRKYMEYLNTMSKFHNYSPNNILLIHLQNPNARLVHGYKAWKNDFGRQVMSGEHAIKIFAPAPYTKTIIRAKFDSNGNQILDEYGKPVMENTEIRIPAFKVVNVFDISQTLGRELPQIGTDELHGDVNNFDLLFKALQKSCPVPIAYEKIPQKVKGYCTEEKIALQEGIGQVQSIKTMIHEMAHHKLHFSQRNEKDRKNKEVEAESVAYTICRHLGIDTSEYSFGYIAGWSTSKEMPELKASLDTIREAASEMINEIDQNFRELLTERKLQYKNASEQGYIYKVRHNPYKNSKEEGYLLQAYVTQENGAAKLGDILYVGNPEKCHELMGKLLAGELTQEQVKGIGKAGKSSVIINLNKKKKVLQNNPCPQQMKGHERGEIR